MDSGIDTKILPDGRKVFYVDIGDLPPEKANEYLKTAIDASKKFKELRETPPGTKNCFVQVKRSWE